MRSNSIFKLFCLMFLLISSNLVAQKTFTGDPDKSFEVARQLAFNKQRKQAQDTLKLILTKYPNYAEVRSFLASTYSWDGLYSQARQEFDIVLKQDPKLKDTWIAAINNELWADKPHNALKKAEDALYNIPNDPDLMLLKSKSLDDIDNIDEALVVVYELLKANPNHQDGLNYKNRLIEKNRKNAIGFGASVDVYSDVFDPTQLHTIKYSRKTKLGSIISKINYSNRFDESAFQLEIDMYPKLGEGLYAYLNIGVANSFLFPDVRFGGELHKSLPNSFEASVGFRALKYSETTTIYTGSVGWYTGNNYWSIRPYITPGDTGTSTSGTLSYRRYGKDADTYFSTSVGIGYSPELYLFKVEENQDQIVDLKSQKFNIGYNFTTSNSANTIGTQLGITHQERVESGNYFWIYSIAITWEGKF